MFLSRLFLSIISALLVVGMLLSVYILATGMFGEKNSHKINKLWASAEEVLTEEQVITENTKVYKQYIYLCGDVEVKPLGETAALVGMNKDDLLEMFAAGDGWQVHFELPEKLVLSRSVDALCSKHENYCHLGIYNGHLAVFQGPLGVNTFLMEVIENKQLSNLPAVWQEKLNKGMEYNSQPLQVKAELEQELEFATEKELYAVLENIDELS